MVEPRYDYVALNQIALNDTGHFVFLDAWTINACLSILAQAIPLYYWMNDQHPLSDVQIDDLEAKLAEVQYQLMNNVVGLIMPICTSVLPQGTLLCDGTVYNRVDYPNLYNAIDSAFIIDADTFQVPDLRDKFTIGSSTTKPVGDTGGSFEHTQTEGELATHTHTNTPHSHTEIGASPILVTIGLEVPTASAIPSAGVTGASSVMIDSAGGGEPMDITPPYIALRYVVVAL